MSSALSPAMAELMSVVASPDDKELASTLITSSMITPSTTHNGLESPKIDVAPRMRIFGAAPKVPETFCTDTPAERPSRPRLISLMPSSLTSEANSWSVAPVKIRLSIFCIPVTTTDAISCALALSMKSMRSASTFFSTGSYPRKETRSTAPEGTFLSV